MRVLTIPLLLAALVAGVYVFSNQVRSHSPTTPPLVHDESQAQTAVSAANFAGAAAALQAWFAARGTYAGAALPDGSGVVVARADATGYCLEDGTAHEFGPNGQPQPGPC